MIVSWPRRALRITLVAVQSALLTAVVLPCDAAAAAETADSQHAIGLAAARRLFYAGHYAEAEAAYRQQLEAAGPPAAVGVARCQAAVGQLDQARKTFENAARKNPKAAELPAEAASLALRRGDLTTAESQAAAALKLDDEQFAARWVQAEVARLRGRLDEANTAYRWFVRYYNAHEVTDPEALRYIGLASAQYARWNRLADQFGTLVNEFYPAALEHDNGYWPAHYEAGCLLLEKYNVADANKAFRAALALNPNAAEVHVALGRVAIEGFELAEAQASADRAVQINPALVEARLLAADIHLANADPQRALPILERAIELNPTSEAAAGRLAAVYAALDGLPARQSDRFTRVVDSVSRRDPHAGEFFAALAAALDVLRRYPLAAQYYEQAIRQMPQLVAARGQWGLVLMRLGEESRAKELLDDAFRVDPFNVRVNNTLQVLDVLSGYETLETPHFIIKYDPNRERILARYVARWLEEIYDPLCRQFHCEPRGKTLFEIFSRSKNTDGHGWFSARMTGLPDVHVLCACAGRIVALESPSELRQRLNWARALKHEFVHVLNLEQTNFNVPHWFTEALAVWSEEAPRPDDWNQLLVQRVPNGDLFTLETINLGFLRPRSSDEWNLAYCQAELYADYMLRTYGDEALARMLSAYADNLSTKEALRRSFHVEQDDFERGYRAFLDTLVADLPKSAPSDTKSIAELTRAMAVDPRNPDLMGRMALAQLQREGYAEARRLADAVLDARPRDPRASYVRARLHLLVGENKQAAAMADEALDRQHPQADLLGLLAGLRLKSEQFDEAAALYQLGATRFPGQRKWTKALAQVYLKSGQQDKLTAVLTELAAADVDELPVRKKLAQLALAAKDYAAAARWTREALQIDVMDVEIHRMLADARAGRAAWDGAIEEYSVALEIDADSAPCRFKLAEAYWRSGQLDKARAALQELVKRQPGYPGADLLTEQLKP